MAKFVLHQDVPAEMFDDEPLRREIERMMEREVIERGVHPIGPMRFSWSRHMPHTVDPFPHLPRMQRFWIRLRLLPRPEPFVREMCGLRGEVEVGRSDR